MLLSTTLFLSQRSKCCGITKQQCSNMVQNSVLCCFVMIRLRFHSNPPIVQFFLPAGTINVFSIRLLYLAFYASTFGFKIWPTRSKCYYMNKMSTSWRHFLLKVDIKVGFKTQDAIVCTSRNHNGNNNYYYISYNDDDDERNNKKGYKKEICLTWMLIIKEK